MYYAGRYFERRDAGHETGGRAFCVSRPRWLQHLGFDCQCGGTTTYLSLIFGELIPKQIALKYPEVIAVCVVSSLRFLARIAVPIVWLPDGCSNFFLRQAGLKSETKQVVTEEDIHSDE